MTRSGYVSVSGKATSSDKYGSVHYLPIHAVSTNGLEITETNGKAIAEVNVITDGYAPQGKLISTELPELEVKPYNTDFSDTYHYDYKANSSYITLYKVLAKGGWAYKSDFFGYDRINVAALNSNSTGLKAENIKAGESIFGVSGTYTGDDPFSSHIHVAYNGAGTYSGQLGYGIEDGFIEDTSVATFRITSPTEGFFDVKARDDGMTRLVIKYYTNSGRTATAFACYTVTCSAF
jgi:hypothetical protein